MSWLSAKAPGRVFINYRRDDALGVAGRLSDSLSRYFGDGRIFRDVDGIAAGANFEEVLKNTTHDADAMIVLIGRQWATLADAQGQPRLHDPDDWVAREIAAALQKGIPIYPVLVENTQMPRAEELPESLKPLARHNAIAISDHRWQSDVTRLAKVVALDIPGSAAERTLQRVRLVVSFALFAAVAVTMGWLCLTWFQLDAGKELVLDVGVLGITFVVLVGSSVVLLFFARLVDPPRRIHVHAAGVVGLAGTFACFVAYKFLNGAPLSAAMVFGSTVTAMAVLVLMNESGFKAR